MSDSENTDNANNSEEITDNTATEKQKPLAMVLKLKNSNPKVFFGAIGGVVVVLLLIAIMSVGSSKKIPQSSFKKLTVGQQYILKGANSPDKNSEISLASVPGTVSAFDEEEEDSSEASSCKQIPEGTSVKIIDLQKTLGITYANVEIMEGKCQGRKGWAISIDIQ